MRMDSVAFMKFREPYRFDEVSGFFPYKDDSWIDLALRGFPRADTSLYPIVGTCGMRPDEAMMFSEDFGMESLQGFRKKKPVVSIEALKQLTRKIPVSTQRRKRKVTVPAWVQNRQHVESTFEVRWDYHYRNGVRVPLPAEEKAKPPPASSGWVGPNLFRHCGTGFEAKIRQRHSRAFDCDVLMQGGISYKSTGWERLTLAIAWCEHVSTTKTQVHHEPIP